jgi:predicted porin
MGSTLFAGSYTMAENKHRGPHHGNSNIFNGGISHQIGKVNLKLGFSQSDISPYSRGRWQGSVPLQQLQNIGIGFKYQAKPNLDIFVAAYRQKASLNNANHMYGNKFVIGANYHLSKRTHVYGFLHQATGSHLGKSISDISSATVGVVHRF